MASFVPEATSSQSTVTDTSKHFRHENDAAGLASESAEALIEKVSQLKTKYQRGARSSDGGGDSRPIGVAPISSASAKLDGKLIARPVSRGTADSSM